ncbi:MAG: alanine--tRNA ligase [Clostridia bacterium]|nr:alanine--tRNA ligase [Clostridia bacterium]
METKKNISSVEIRDRFISFFKGKDHMEITDSSVVPKNDPTLLFINSGMAPIKNYFTGVEKPPYPRLCDIQPCIRTIDIDSIGDKHHLTSFQMLGSWSINDYFKEKAIALAFEFLTQHLNIPKEKLFVTVFAGDDEIGLPCDDDAYEYWKKVGVEESHIVKCGKEDNFWGPTAETGPCGPCTEIFYDTGEGQEYIPGGEFDTKKRYIEIWNAGVFMQLNKNADGTFSKLGFTSVDTGAGLERLAMVLNGYSTVYDTDLLKPIKDQIINKTSEMNKNLPEKDVLIITDHLRTATLILSENVKPSNEGRGYIPRKLIRRCMMLTTKTKIMNFDFSKIIEFIVDNYSNMFPKFAKNKEFIIKEFKKEQNQFEKIVVKGTEMLESIKLNRKVISGQEAFDLVTTYGLPFDIVKQYALENGMSVDEKEFKNKLDEHKEKSRNISNSALGSSLKDVFDLVKNAPETEFLGYDQNESTGKILKLFIGGKEVSSAEKGDKVSLIFDKTVFYATSGGQCSDSGYVHGKNFKIKIDDVQKNNNVYIHSGEVEFGKLKVGDMADLVIDKEKRLKIANNHTAVHLLQSALQNIYGKNLHQTGSKVEESKLRFDFNYDNQISEEEIFEIEKLVNLYIRKNIPRKVEIKELSEALESGAMALFENKYGEKVRVVNFGNVSSELCGGTHTEFTGNIGMFTVLSIEGIGKGLKRITAVTGEEALKHLQNKVSEINEISKMLKVKPSEITGKIQKMMDKKSLDKNTCTVITEKDIKPFVCESGMEIGVVNLEEGSKKTANELIKIADKIKKIVICIVGQEKKQIIVAVNDEQVENYRANEMLAKIMEKLGGKGGGNKKLATGGTMENNVKISDAIKESL